MREQDQGLTTEDMAGRGGAPAHDQSPERGDGQDAPHHEDQPVHAGGQPQDGGQSAEEGPGGRREELMGRDQAGEFQDRWRQVQSRFVDDPRAAVQEADALVAETMQALAASFADERRTLEAQWSRSEGDAATEELRQAFRRYRSFFERLLST